MLGEKLVQQPNVLFNPDLMVAIYTARLGTRTMRFVDILYLRVSLNLYNIQQSFPYPTLTD
jgi:hypothetical protein